MILFPLYKQEPGVLQTSVLPACSPIGEGCQDNESEEKCRAR